MVKECSIITMKMFIMGNGKMVSNMDLDNIDMLMVMSMKDFGMKVKNKVKELCNLTMVIFMKENLIIMKNMAKEFIKQKKELNLKVILKMVLQMIKMEKFIIPMEMSMKEKF